MTDHTAATEIAFILDRSGSMSPLTEAAISGFNEFLKDQQKAEGIARMTLVLFDNEYLVPADNIPVGEIVELDTTTFVARGSTALLDAVGRTIEGFDKRIKALPEGGRPAAVVFAIFTDGEENSSLDYTWKDIARLIRDRQEQDGWQFLFLAANQDAIATAAQMNIGAHNAATSDYSAKGMEGTLRSFSRKVRSIRESSVRPDEPVPEDYHKPMSDILGEEEGREGTEG